METMSVFYPQETSPKSRRHAVTKSPHFVTATFPGHTLYHSTAEIISNGVRSNRTCTIQICKFFKRDRGTDRAGSYFGCCFLNIANHLNVPLVDPRFHCFDGCLYYPLPHVIQPGTREACVFSKNR